MTLALSADSPRTRCHATNGSWKTLTTRAWTLIPDHVLAEAAASEPKASQAVDTAARWRGLGHKGVEVWRSAGGLYDVRYDAPRNAETDKESR
jgi:hypothetical protein